MSVRVEKADLPEIGPRHDVITKKGRCIGVVSHRSGERELALFDIDDPDAATDSIALFDDEADALADLRGADVIPSPALARCSRRPAPLWLSARAQVSMRSPEC